MSEERLVFPVQPDGTQGVPVMREYRRRGLKFPTPDACDICRVTASPEWRRGPKGLKTLCNACGLQYGKLLKGLREKAELPSSAGLHALLRKRCEGRMMRQSGMLGAKKPGQQAPRAKKKTSQQQAAAQASAQQQEVPPGDVPIAAGPLVPSNVMPFASPTQQPTYPGLSTFGGGGSAFLPAPQPPATPAAALVAAGGATGSGGQQHLFAYAGGIAPAVYYGGVPAAFSLPPLPAHAQFPLSLLENMRRLQHLEYQRGGLCLLPSEAPPAAQPPPPQD